MKKNRNKPYNPNSKFNPAFQARKIDKFSQQLQVAQRQIEAISHVHNIHIAHLANFARHDIKNAIQNMDSILSTTAPGDFDEQKIGSISTSLDIIRTTIDNFAKLVPYSTTGAFTLDVLMVAVELLARADMQKHEIEMIFVYPKESTVPVTLPFQAVLQMMNNLVLNAIKSLENVAAKKMHIEATLSGGHLQIRIQDNGHPINTENRERVFEYGYSTTGGSGIGLFHARYLCTEFKGEISVNLMPDPPYTKTFTVILPLTIAHGKDRSNH